MGTLPIQHLFFCVWEGTPISFIFLWASLSSFYVREKTMVLVKTFWGIFQYFSKIGKWFHATHLDSFCFTLLVTEFQIFSSLFLAHLLFRTPSSKKIGTIFGINFRQSFSSSPSFTCPYLKTCSPVGGGKREWWVSDKYAKSCLS